MSAARIHHLNCATMCPRPARLLPAGGGWTEAGRMVCHCLLIEGARGLTLVDAGIGQADLDAPRRLGRLFAEIARPRYDPAEPAVARVRQLGFDPRDVRDIVVTHLDIDHAGGLADFPEARVHVTARELAAATAPSLHSRLRYLRRQLRHGPRWVPHTGHDAWCGLPGAAPVEDLDVELWLVPTVGHSRGHASVAVRHDGGWFLHCGDAYFDARQVAPRPRCAPGLWLFQELVQDRRRSRMQTLRTLRALARRHPEVTLICSHDPEQLSRLQASG